MNNDALRTLQRYRDALLSLAPVDRTLDGTPEQLARLIREQRATAQAEIAALRAKWEALRGAVADNDANAIRAAKAMFALLNPDRPDWYECSDSITKGRFVAAAHATIAALTDSTHALEADQ